MLPRVRLMHAYRIASSQAVLTQENDESAEVAADEAEASVSPPKSPLPQAVAKLAPAEPVKLTAEVSLVPRTDSAAKRGWLALPAEAHSDRWVRRWFVLRR